MPNSDLRIQRFRRLDRAGRVHEFGDADPDEIEAAADETPPEEE